MGLSLPSTLTVGEVRESVAGGTSRWESSLLLWTATELIDENWALLPDVHLRRRVLSVPPAHRMPCQSWCLNPVPAWPELVTACDGRQVCAGRC